MDTAAPDPVPKRSWTFRCGDGVDGLVSHGPVDHCIMDPPYAEEVDNGNAAVEVRDNAFGFDPMNENLRFAAARAVSMRTRRWVLVFCSLEEAHLWRFALVSAGLSYYRTGLWIRLNTAPQFNGLGPAQAAEAIVIAHSRVLPQRWNGGGRPAIWSHAIERNNRQHPTQKPGDLMRELVRDFTDEGELIADPFAGVGTTGVAAVGLGRRFVGWEKDTQHYTDGLKRLELPLLESAHRPSYQTDLLPTKRKGAAARARMELDRHVLNILVAAGDEGVQASKIPDLIGGEDHDIRRSLHRLKRAEVVNRQGRTSETRWYAQEQA